MSNVCALGALHLKIDTMAHRMSGLAKLGNLFSRSAALPLTSRTESFWYRCLVASLCSPALESLSSVSVTDGQIDSWRAVLVCQLPAATANLPASCQLNQIGYDTSLLNKQIKLQLIIVFNFRFLNDQASWRKSTKASPR